MIFTLLFYTLVLLSFLFYLLYLKSSNIIQYHKILFNLHFYVFVFYLLLFILSSLATFAVYAADCAGVALAQHIKNVPVELVTTSNDASLQGSTPMESTADSRFAVPGSEQSKVSDSVNTPSEKGSKSKFVEALYKPIQSAKQMFWGRVVDTCVEECDTLSSNSEKIARDHLFKFKPLDKTVSMKEISTHTSSTKSPIIIHEDIRNGKSVYHLCVDLNCSEKLWSHSAASAGAKDKISIAARAGLKIVNNFSEFQDPRCIEIEDKHNILGDLFSKRVDKPDNNELSAPTRSATPRSPATPSNSPFNQF